MMDAIGAFLSVFSRQVWQLEFLDAGFDQPNSKLRYTCGLISDRFLQLATINNND